MSQGSQDGGLSRGGSVSKNVVGIGWEAVSQSHSLQRMRRDRLVGEGDEEGIGGRGSPWMMRVSEEQEEEDQGFQPCAGECLTTGSSEKASKPGS